MSKDTGKASAQALASTAERLHTVTIHLLRRLRRQDEQMGLSGPRSSALSVLVFGGPASLAQLAAAEQVKPPTMARIVDALEAAGLVTREVDSRDLRAVSIRATVKGRRLLLEGRARRMEQLTSMLAQTSLAERQALVRAVDTLQRVLKHPPPD